MRQIQGIVVGTAPILFSRWTSTEGIKGAGAGGGKFTEEQRLDEAMQKVYRNPDGGLGVPKWNFKKCLLEGCTKAGLKVGRASLTKFLEASVFVVADPHFIDKTEIDYVHEVPGRRPPRTGGAVLIKRPALAPGWRLAFGLTVVDDRRSIDQIRTALDEAGMLVGLGSWRPEYGRFIVTEWQA